jgi:hypothetical protein
MPGDGRGRPVQAPTSHNNHGQTNADLLVWAPAYLRGFERGYLMGHEAALVAVAADCAELKPEHLAVGELVHADRVARRIAEFDRLAARDAMDDFARRHLFHDLGRILALPDEPRFRELRGRAAIRLRSLRVTPPAEGRDYVPYLGGPVAWDSAGRRAA